MAKINRYDGSPVPFAKNATGTNRTIFGDVTQSDELTANIDGGTYQLGWEIVGPSGKPTIEDFSGAMFTNAQLSAYLHQMGVAEWNDKQEYQIGSIANRDGVLYSCKTADHVSVTPPESDPTNWESAIPADLLNTVRINVASAATVDLTANAPDTRHINITGSNAISAFTVASGQCYFVRFDAAATITSGASIVTQSGSNIAVAQGDTCLIRSTATDIVEILCYTRAVVGRFQGDYEEILPLGSYVSGSFTIPGGRKWTDFSSVILIGFTTNINTSNSAIATGEMIAANPTGFIMRSRDNSSDNGAISATSLTSFTVSRNGAGAVAQVIGYLKPGVA